MFIQINFTYHGTLCVDTKIFCPQDPNLSTHRPSIVSCVRNLHCSDHFCADLAAAVFHL